MIISQNELIILEKIMEFERKNDEKGLLLFLKKLTLDDIKKIQLVMYIGRGYIDTSISDDEIKTPVKLYQNFESTFNFIEDKDIEIETILGKFNSLIRYIEQGIEILN